MMTNAFSHRSRGQWAGAFVGTSPGTDDEEAPATVRDPHVPEGCIREPQVSFTKLDLFGVAPSALEESLAAAPPKSIDPVMLASIAADPVELPFYGAKFARWFLRVSEATLTVTLSLASKLPFAR